MFMILVLDPNYAFTFSPLLSRSVHYLFDQESAQMAFKNNTFNKDQKKDVLSCITCRFLKMCPICIIIIIYSPLIEDSIYECCPYQLKVLGESEVSVARQFFKRPFLPHILFQGGKM